MPRCASARPFSSAARACSFVLTLLPFSARRRRPSPRRAASWTHRLGTDGDGRRRLPSPQRTQADASPLVSHRTTGAEPRRRKNGQGKWEGEELGIHYED